MKYPETVIITGANGQCAVHIARELLKNGCRLFLLAHVRVERIALLKQEFPDLCFITHCDLSNYEQTEIAISNLISTTGYFPEALVHTAAIRSTDAKALFESEPDVWNNVLTQNISYAYNTLRAVLPMLVKANQGKIVLFGSSVTQTGLPYGSAYSAAKAAIANMMLSVASEMAPYNIQINMISPAPVDTNLEEDYEGDYLTFRQEYFEAFKKTHPSGKLVSPDDVTNTVLTLLNTETNTISGEEVYLPGGVL
jgi:NAD(P)-dependent dehydrogenase (short-subunit alcohol dehydrogenase family)